MARERKRRGPSKDPSIFEEPHLQADAGHAPDPSEAAAARRIDRDSVNEHPDEEAARSVFDEPTLVAGRDELGPRADGLTFASHWARRAADVSPGESWFWLVLAAMVSGPLAVVGVFIGAGFSPTTGPLFGVWGAVVITPCVEEVLKTWVVAGLVERRPWLVRRKTQIVFVALCSGLAFAAVENALYLLVYIDEPSLGIIVWRWTACVALHAGASAVAGVGLALAWSRGRDRGERPSLEAGFPYLLTAIVAHGLFNLVATVLGLFRVF